MLPLEAFGDDRSSYDYVIIGAGTAGCIVASRLVACGRYSVLLLEAGEATRNPLISLPMGVGHVWNAPAYNWSYVSEAEPQLGGRRLALPRGRLVGGSSAINAMNHVRGNPADYDDWSRAGLEGWSFDSLLPLFKRTESFAQGEENWRGRSGPIGITEATHADPVVPALFESLERLGFRPTADYNGEYQEGFGRGQFAIAGGRRNDAASCFLYPAMRKGSISLRTAAQVCALCFDGRRVRGVRYEQAGIVREVHADREVILCAGAFNSPQLLMLSGIGPANELAGHGIAPVLDRATVGRNLIEHPRATVEFSRRMPSSIHRALRYDRLAGALARAYFLGTGTGAEPLAAAHLFLRSGRELDRPDLQILFRLFNPRLRPRRPFERTGEADTLGMVVCLLRPASRGQVGLRSADPLDAPRIRTGILREEADVRVLLSGLAIARRIGREAPLSTELFDEAVPGKSVESETALREWLLANADTIFHPCGTCAMGADEASVTNSELKVRGLEGIRIADASVIPQPLSGNINAAVMMIAEKAAEMILTEARAH